MSQTTVGGGVGNADLVIPVPSDNFESGTTLDGVNITVSPDANGNIRIVVTQPDSSYTTFIVGVVDDAMIMEIVTSSGDRIVVDSEPPVPPTWPEQPTWWEQGMPWPWANVNPPSGWLWGDPWLDTDGTFEPADRPSNIPPGSASENGYDWFVENVHWFLFSMGGMLGALGITMVIMGFRRRP